MPQERETSASGQMAVVEDSQLTKECEGRWEVCAGETGWV